MSCAPNPTRIVLVHGIFAREGDSNVWNMKAPLEAATGLPVAVFEYGYTGILGARLTNNRTAKRLAHMLMPGDIIVCHSNGAAVTWLATHKHGARPAGVVMINPALDSWRMPLADWAHVYYNAEDTVVWWSKLLVGNVWGEMGRIGYRPRGINHTLPDTWIDQVDGDKRIVTGIEQIDTIVHAKGLLAPPAKGHIAMFQSPCVAPWGAIVGRKINQEPQRWKR